MANEFVARKGLVTLDNARITGSLSTTGAIEAGTNLTVNSNATILGNTTLGDNSSDKIVTTGRVSSSVVPFDNIQHDLGSNSNRWLTVYGQAIDLTGDATIGGNTVIVGDLTVQGDVTNIQVSDLFIEDKLIVIASGSTTGVQADGGGWFISGANASFTYDHSNVRFTSNIPISASFVGDGSGLSGIAGTINLSGSTTTGTISTASVDLQAGAIFFSGSNGIESVVDDATDRVAIRGILATTTSPGVASFSTTNFTVASGVVSTKDITVNGKSATLGGTINLNLEDITQQAASSSVQVDLNAGATIANTLHSASVNPDVDIGTEVVATVSTGSYGAAFFDYYVNDGTNYRAGTVTSVWAPGTSNVQFTDVSTLDIGNTSGVSFEVDLLNDLARLKATVGTDNWSIKTITRAI